MGSLPLIEREPQLRALREVFSEPFSSGSVVLVSGEAGFGKTSLVELCLEDLDHRHSVLKASCEPLGIPAAFDPLFDLNDQLPVALRSDLRAGTGRMSVYAGMLDLVKNDRVVLVLEDVHWADEATLGLIRYLGRRIGATRSVLIVTYRSEEIDLNPPLRLVVSDLGSVAHRVDLPSLTPQGVAKLVEGLGLDSDAVYQATLGNPFFVQEVARHPDLAVPPSVQNAVLASTFGLPESAMQLLRMVASSPDGLPVDLFAALGDPDRADADPLFNKRLLVLSRGQISCRHELVRQSIAQAIPPATRQRLHERLLAAFEDRRSESPDVARLAFHAVASGAPEKAAKYSLQAARDAARAGAHRQSAFHYANALLFEPAIDGATLLESLLAAAEEHNAINAFDTAMELSRKRLELIDSPVEVAKARAWVSFFESRRNDLRVSRQESESATAILRQVDPCQELALALSVLAWVELVEGNPDTARGVGEEAIEVARLTGATGIEVHAAATVGTALSTLGDRTGFARVEEAARLGVHANSGEFAARAINNLGYIALIAGRLEQALGHFDGLIEYATTHELDAWYIAAVASRAWVEVISGRWDQADQDIEIVAGQKTCFQTEIEALDVSATLRLRRGDPGALELIAEVTKRLEDFNDHDAEVSGCRLVMEAAWVGLLPLSEAEHRYASITALPVLNDDRSGRAILGFWANRLGFETPTPIPGPAGLEQAGEEEEAAQRWESRGYFMEPLVTRAVAAGADLASAFSDLAAMGADGIAVGLRRELQRRGVKHIPRGERLSTRRNPAGLTPREYEVLGLIAAGLSNAVIAEEMFITEKTAGHHVSAVLAKLSVASRGQAAALAVANGWVEAR